MNEINPENKNKNIAAVCAAIAVILITSYNYFTKSSNGNESPQSEIRQGDASSAINPGTSTKDDFSQFERRGGININDSWRGFWIVGYDVGFRNNILSDAEIKLSVEGLKSKGQKDATIDNVMGEIGDLCGNNWSKGIGDFGESGGYFTETESARCEVMQKSSDLLLSVRIKS